MALSEETKQKIGLEYQDKTLKQLAKENGCSVSSVQRVIKSTIAEQEKMKTDHAAQSKDGAGESAGGDTTDAFTFTPSIDPCVALTIYSFFFFSPLHITNQL